MNRPPGTESESVEFHHPVLDFDEDWYLRYYPDVARGVELGEWSDAQAHYRSRGEREGRSPNPCFEELWVRALDPALTAAIEGGDFRSAAEHYRRIGHQEGRRVARWFDPTVYSRPEASLADGGSLRRLLESGVESEPLAVDWFDPHEYTVHAGLDGCDWEGCGGPLHHFLRFGLVRGIEITGPSSLEGDEGAYLSLIRRRLLRFLARGSFLRVPRAARPLVSVVLPVTGEPGLLLRFLRSLVAKQAIPLELLLVDRFADRATRDLVARVEGARVLPWRAGEGRVRAVDRALCEARGRFLLLVDGAGALEEGALGAAVDVLLRDEQVAAVTGRVVDPRGRIVASGWTFGADGTAMPLGRGDDCFDRAHSYRRSTPAGCRRFLLTDRARFEQIGGFDRDYLTLDGAAWDYSLRLWKAGQATVVEPRTLVWWAGPVDDRHPQAQAWGERDRLIAGHRHQSLLRRVAQKAQVPWQGAPLAAASRRRRMLYCDDRAPETSLGSGYPRARRLLCELDQLGWQVTLLPLAAEVADLEVARSGLPPTVEILEWVGPSGLEQLLEERPGFYDVLWVSRPFNMRPVVELSGRRPELFAGTRILYDAEALFSLRESRRPADSFSTGGRGPSLDLAGEIELANGADLVVTVSAGEAQILAAEGIPTRVVGYATTETETSTPFGLRSGLLIVSAIHQVDSPNYDGLAWFLERVWPSVRAQQPELELHVAGYWEPGLPRPSAVDGVHWHGRQEDLAPLYEAARVFVAPTRYGAGIPLKILEATAHGIPVVTTREMAAALDWSTGDEFLAVDAERPEQFAAEVLRVYHDEDLWTDLRRGASERLAREYSHEVFSRAVEGALADLVGAGPELPAAGPRAESPPWGSRLEPELGAESPWIDLSLPSFSSQQPPSDLVSSHRRWRSAQARERAFATMGSPPVAEEPQPGLPSEPDCGIGDSEVPDLEPGIPEFTHRRWTRWIARQVARCVLLATRFLTVPQAHFNRALKARLARLEEETQRFARQVIDSLAQTTAQRERIRGRVNESLVLHQGQLHGLETSLARCQALRAADLEELALEIESLRGVPPQGGSGDGRPGAVADEPLRALYSALQERFRGPRTLVRDRCQEYLPMVRDLPSDVSRLPWVDVGCGRGEWVELLAEEGVEAVGVDEDAGAIAACRERGLAALRTDALDYLSSLDPGSVQGVSALHVVEHWEISRLLAFLEEARRVLAPGGVVLLETPNPHNLVTGGLHFHYDPTHHRPVPPALLLFLLEHCGFERAEDRWLTAHREGNPLSSVAASNGLEGSVNQLVEVVNRHLLSPPDYSVVAYRAEPS